MNSERSKPKTKRQRVAEALVDVQMPRPFTNPVLTKCPAVCNLLLTIAEGTKYQTDAELAVKEIYPDWPEI